MTKLFNKLFAKKQEPKAPMVTTKKILSAIDLDIPHKDFKDFVYVSNDSNEIHFKGIKKGKEFKYGIVTLTSTISENDVFKRIIDNSNDKIDSVDFLIGSIAYYLEEVSRFKIGNVIAIKPADNEFGFELEKVKERVSMTVKNKLP
ncbi:hypothetical protein [Plebeiibacterium sediminum]|uniref:Uncharacterized protein n=1 Tax=Plebeiibacterium sediminum TaxID=2992112 RepID=A0AAE3M9Z6_9BACT|nr:hypothetical protein [Plebeiobacterium sediminum]MCW3789534.1 hypothetical protein [Plebeiobacterium sediminum]